MKKIYIVVLFLWFSKIIGQEKVVIFSSKNVIDKKIKQEEDEIMALKKIANSLF